MRYHLQRIRTDVPAASPARPQPETPPLATATVTTTSTPVVGEPAPTGHPIGFWFIFTGELAERASFYGMKAVLLLYLIEVFAYKRSDASSIVHLYVAACYLTPLIGGLLADLFLNKYWTIVAFAVPYVIGQFLVGLSNEYLMFGALALLSFGSGVIKPNISTLMGMTYDQQRPGQVALRNKAFTWFYVAINLGSFLSTLVCPFLRDYFGGALDPVTNKRTDPQAGYFAAFMFPAVLMSCALVCFALGKRYYAVEKLGYLKWGQPPEPEQETRAEKIKVVTQILGLFILVMFFWAIFDQHASTWTLFANDYLDLTISAPNVTRDRPYVDFFGSWVTYTLAPDQIQAVNPLLIVIFAPLVSILFARLGTAGYPVRATNKMILGFLITSLAMGIHAYAGYLAVQPDGTVVKVTVWWQVLAYFAITIAEILISVTGLELAFTAAPQSMKGFITSLWLLMVFMANFFINTPVSRLYPSQEEGLHFASPVTYFGMLSVAMLVVTLAFVFVARNFNRNQLKA